MDTPKYEDLNASNGREVSIRIHYPEFYNHLMTAFPQDLTFPERIYWYYNNLKEHPVCIACGNPVAFINFRLGYREFCSTKCVNTSGEVTKRKQATCLRNYGVTNPMQSKTVRERQEDTVLKKYGTTNVFKNDNIKGKIKERNRERLGVDYPMQNVEVRQKMLESRREGRMRMDDNIIGFDKDGNYIVKCPHAECNGCTERYYIINSQHYYDRIHWMTEPCTRLLPIQDVHPKNTTIELFVQKILDEHNIKYQTNVRNILGGKELDIYIPDKNIAIECNGIYWHSKCPDRYHYDKFKTCGLKGIQLLTLWEDQIIRIPAIMESLIKSKLGIYERRLGARECEVRVVSPRMCGDFLRSNHVQGTSFGTVHLGLFDKDNIPVGVMLFGRRPGNMDGPEWELVRYASLRGVQVIGGAGKLFQYFINKYNPDSVISYSSNDISVGGIYKTLGFLMTREAYGTYWYIERNTKKRFHRSNFTKTRLKKMGYDTENMTEREIVCGPMRMLRITDSGQRTWVWSSRK